MQPTKQSRNKLSLKEIKQRILDWRNTRSKHSRIPDELWGSVRDLIDHYSLDDISSSLNISSKQIQARFDIVANPITFVQVKAVSSPVTKPSISTDIHALIILRVKTFY
jgi:AraC-like DNA-binding protein